jgi:hypothetical protein
MTHTTHSETPAPNRRKRRPWIGFVLAGICGILAVFVLHGNAAGMAAAACMLGLIAACLNAMRAAEPGTLSNISRAGLGGWLGGGF